MNNHPRLQAVALACASLLAALPAAAGSVRFQVAEMATPAGQRSFAYDINDHGQLVGTLTGADNKQHAAAWNSAGQLVPLQQGVSQASVAYAVNNLGQVAGWIEPEANYHRAALWNGTALTMLSTAGNSCDEAYDINDDGILVGKARAANGYDHAAAWTNGRIVDLGAATTGAEVFSSASTINRWGMIGGSAWTVPSGGGDGPLFWTMGPGESVSRHGRFGNIGMNDLGQALGMVDLDPSQHVLVPVFIAADGRTTQILPGTTYGTFTKLNNAGQAIGGTNSAAMLWSAQGGAVALNGVLKPGSSGVQHVRGINELGQLAATTFDGRAAVLTPTGTLRWTGPSANGFFGDAENWDSGLGFAPNRFLDVELASNRELDVVGPSWDLDVKSLVVGGTGQINRLYLHGDARLTALEGTRLLAGARLAVTAGSDAVFATGYLGGDLTMLAGSAIELKADAEGPDIDRLVIDGMMYLQGGDFVLTFDGRYQAEAGASWDFMDFEGVQGTFAQLVLPTLGTGLAWDASRLYSDGVLGITAAVPEPASSALLALGMAAVGWRLRRRG